MRHHSSNDKVCRRSSIMSMHRDCCSLLKKCVYIAFLFAIVAAQECDKTKCPGPLRYYKALGCTPVYEHQGDCCPSEYNCDNLKNLAKNKCYVNGHEYNVGDSLRDEDANPCDKGCRCQQNGDRPAKFVCAVVDCFFGPPGGNNCYRRNSPTQCCSGPEVCLKEGEERPTCVVDGVTYKDGDSFTPQSDPDKTCYCMPGYEGKNIEPFCKAPNHDYCDPIMRYPDNVHDHCAPVYYVNQSPQEDCNVAYRCQNSNDTVIHNHGELDHSHEEHATCTFGNLEMHLGDELNQATNYDSVCVKCICQVPPVPTCQRLPDSECDVTKHPKFD